MSLPTDVEVELQSVENAIANGCGRRRGRLRGLRDVLEREFRLLETDALTGVQTRRGIEESLANAAARAARFKSDDKTALSVAIVDIDHFKKVNDEHGHLEGDKLLRELGRQLRLTVRRYDSVGRWGGEEFVLVLPGLHDWQAVKLVERLRKKVYQNLLTTISIGVASVISTGGSPSCDWRAALENADKALYAAKHGGRNQVRKHA